MRDRREDAGAAATRCSRLPGAASATRRPACASDTGERVLVGDSVAVRRLPPCRAGRPQICRAPRWVLGGFAELIAAPEAALHAGPGRARARGRRDGRAARRAPCTPSPRAGARDRARRRRARRRADGPDARRAAGRRGPRRSRSPTATPSAARRPRRSGAHGRRALARPRRRLRGRRPARGLARRGRRRCAPGGCVVLVGGCAGGTDAALPDRARCTTTSSTSAAPSTTRRAEVDRALALLAERRRRLARARRRARSASTTWPPLCARPPPARRASWSSIRALSGTERPAQVRAAPGADTGHPVGSGAGGSRGCDARPGREQR